MRRLLLCLCGLLLVAPAARAAAPSVVMAAPFQIVNGAAVILVTIDGKQVPALVDTGAQVSAIDKIYANARGLLPLEGLGGSINGQQADPSLDHDVFLGNQRLAYGVILTNLSALPAGVPMILGDDALKQFIVEFDFDAMQIRFHPQSGFTAPANAQQLPMKLNTRRQPSVAVSIEGSAPVQALLDSGFSGPFGMSQASADKLGVGDRKGVAVQGRGINTRGTSNGIVLGKLKLGNDEMTNVPAIIFDKNQPEIGVLPAVVGLPVLQRYHSWLDIDHQKLWLMPRPQLVAAQAPPRPQPAAASRGPSPALTNQQLIDQLTSRAASVGLKVEYTRYTHVVAVVAGSRAATAGLKAGDDIWLVNNQDARAFFATHTDFSGALAVTLSDQKTVLTLPADQSSSPSSGRP